MRSLLCVTALLLVAACATPHRPEGSPSRVVVVGASVARSPGPRGVVTDLLGGEEPREVVAREAADALRGRGFEVVEVQSPSGLAPTSEQAAALARGLQADATVVVVLTGLDLSALQPLGQAAVALEWRMVGPDGRVFASDARRIATTERLYQAQMDWRSHVRQAVIQAIRELP